MAERVAAGERQSERFPVVGRVMAGKRLEEWHFVAILSFAAAVPHSNGLFVGLAGRGPWCH